MDPVRVSCADCAVVARYVSTKGLARSLAARPAAETDHSVLVESLTDEETTLVGPSAEAAARREATTGEGR